MTESYKDIKLDIDRPSEEVDESGGEKERREWKVFVGGEGAFREEGNVEENYLENETDSDIKLGPAVLGHQVEPEGEDVKDGTGIKVADPDANVAIRFTD